ncbi:MAG: aminoacyl--tRNA ligase-related protein [Candidatus Thermoplasmatota archaeon]|mgnify:FL=1|nr:His/Gly/Thr/Pro-type tRNA ligase C-terminal domain-containing protein [Candidatus Thalassarchaeaceae archaeon]MEC7105107.1 aminoacyl--tRNA ligase-related protein [Candidatus Thermoplasmatota archaeon]MEC7365113.1 aminoacyl--tRNA ligase-related protein [Candidatus Thermoplasmatota archaeon]MEC7459013.1 aminoacyl--tRNA ligase-related protein [Candidatus Thermoplasmatota archaeon]MEC8171368.1 aminoacyl--tRNA ligase-related protein [Candidatus Thermoplasmatota archaeon]
MSGPSKAKRGIPPKSEFNKWYPAIVEIADLVDKRYPIKGMDVWKPYGLTAMGLIDSLARREMSRTGHHEHRFPLLVPEDLLDKENKLVSILKAARESGVDPSELRFDEEASGFKKEVYWVTHGGENKLEMPMFLRPTSETPMYTMFSLWVRSHADLPLKTFQIVNTFRYETKQTRSFIRVREIHFFEAHTVHADQTGADEQIEEDAEMVQRIMHDLCLPSLVSKRPVWDTFPGAWYTMAADVVMPNGRTLQVATYHHYKDQWANAFDLSYEDPEGNTKPCHQTTFGMSERLLGAVVGMHGDDKGLILPPAIAPIQVVVLPIAAHADSNVEPAAQALAERLSASGIRVELDTRDVRPGVKHYDWEIKGVPIRLELGPRDLSAGNVVLILRTGSKFEISIEEAEKSVLESLEGLAEDLRQRAKSLVSDKVQPFPFDNLDYDDSQESSIENGIVYQIAFQGNDSDAEFLEKKTGLTLLGECVDEFPEERNCIITGKATKKMQHIARMY